MSLNFKQLLQPVPRSGIWEEDGYFVWCGSLTRHEGRFHLVYSRWPREHGFEAWVTHSEIALAVADSALGPFRHLKVLLPARGAEYWDGLCTHNPIVCRFGDKYYLYYMGNTGDGVVTKGLNWTHRNNQRIGVAVAEHPAGPWQRGAQPLISPTANFLDALCCANPSVVERPEGGFLMVYKGVGDKGAQPFGGPVTHIVATAQHPTGPFHKHPEPVFTVSGVDFPAEDPGLWVQDGEYWAIVKDMTGSFTGAGRSLALFGSRDGLQWFPAPDPLVSGTEIQWDDGSTQSLLALERPQLWLDEGVPSVLLCAADTGVEGESTFNVRIPLK